MNRPPTRAGVERAVERRIFSDAEPSVLMLFRRM